MTAFALVLVLAVAAALVATRTAPASARPYLQFAAVLYGALALSQILAIAVSAVTDIATTLGAVCLSVGAYSGAYRAPRPFTATAVLGVAAICGIAAAATDLRVLAGLPQVLSAVFLLLIARPGLWRRSSIYFSASALCLIGAAASHLTQGAMARAGLLAFAGAALLGVTLGLNILVENQRSHRGRPPIRLSR